MKKPIFSIRKLLLLTAAQFLLAQSTDAQKPGNIFSTTNAQRATTEEGGGVSKPDYPITPFVLATKDLRLSAGDTITIDFAVFGFTNLSSYQFALSFDTSYLRFAKLETDSNLAVNGANFGLFNINAGELRSVFAQTDGVSLPDYCVLFELSLAVLQDDSRLSNRLSLDSVALIPKAFDAFQIERSLILRFTDDLAERAAAFEKPAFEPVCTPNPFEQEATVTFDMPVDVQVQWRIWSMSGCELWSSGGYYGKGAQRIGLPGFLPKGTLLLQASTPFGLFNKLIIHH